MSVCLKTTNKKREHEFERKKEGVCRKKGKEEMI